MAFALLQAGAFVNFHTQDTGTALYQAARYGHIDCALVLIRAGANVECGYNDWTPLIAAARNGYIRIVKALLWEEARVDARLSSGLTALYKATVFGHIDCALALIRAGANVEYGYNDWTPLIAAARNGYIQIVNALLGEEARVDVRLSGGTTALYQAAFYGCIDCALALISAGANVEYGDNDWTPLIAAAAKGHIQIVNALLGKEARVNARLSDGTTALYRAAYYGHIDCALALIRAGANVEYGYKAYTPLIIAAEKGHIQIVNALLGKEARVEARLPDGTTALYHCINAVERVLSPGCDAGGGN